MALKTRLGCCLLLSLFVFVEMAASDWTCDAIIDVTFLIDFSSSLQDNLEYEIAFFVNLLHGLFPSPNDVLANIRFYPPFVLQYRPPIYVSFKNKGRLWAIMERAMTYFQRVNEGEDVITALIAASRPETDCRRKRGGRRIVVVVIADAVDTRVLMELPSPDFRNLMEERGVEIVALAIGNNSTLDVLDDILDPNYGDTIIRLDSFNKLLSGDVLDEVLKELCEETQEMRLYREKMSASFQRKYTYNKHSYYLSKEYFDNLTQVHDTCSLAGGYLAVINDQQEYDAMKQYFTDNNPGHSFIIDGSDAVKEGMWTLLSGAPLPFVDWLPNNPRQEIDDCLGVGVGSSLKMFDTLCDGLPGKYPYFFLCEVSDESEISNGYTCSHSF